MIFRNLVTEAEAFANPALVAGDWKFGKGTNDYVSLNQAIGLNIKTRLQSWLNDCFFDLPAGIDWKNYLGSLNKRGLLEADLRRVILQSDNVTGILSFDTELSPDRKFTANYEIQTIYSKSFRDSVTVGVFNA